MKSMSVWFRAVLLIAVLAGGAAACAAGAATTTGAPAPSTTSKSAARHGRGVSSHIRVSDSLVSGAAERGTLVVVNHTARPIHWSCGYFDVQLTNAHFPLEIHPTPCSLRGKTFRVGSTRLPFTLRASQIVCEGACRALPPGTYRTQVFAAPPFIHPPAVTVHVTAAR
jgi:hypothetical protein